MTLSTVAAVDRAVRKRLCQVLIAMAIVLLSASQAAASNAFIYALTQDITGPNRIYGFRIDQITGDLTLLPGFPIDSGGTAERLVAYGTLEYFNGRLYVINDGTDTLSAFTVNLGSGALTHLPFSPIALGSGQWNCVAVHPSGSPVVVGNGIRQIASFVVTPTTATPAPGSPYTTSGAEPSSCAFRNSGNVVYAGGLAAPFDIAAFSVSVASGILTPLAGSPFESGAGYAVGYATDSSGRLFTAGTFTNEVRVFTTSGGVPTAVTGNPFSAGGLMATSDGVLHQSGFYMVADWAGGTTGKVGVYRISGSGAGTTVTAVSGSPFLTGGSFTNSLALTTKGGFLVAANGITRNLTVFRVNKSTGSLTSVGVQPVNTLGLSGRVTGVTFASNASEPGDFDGDAKSDITVFRPSTGQWLTIRSGTNFSQTVPWGLSGDIDVPCDYDGDGRIDPAVFRPSTQAWYILRSSTNTYTIASWGLSTDLLVPGDYDGDGKADPAVWRPSTRTWYAKGLSVYPVWGLSTDRPVPADYDGDGKFDPAVYRPSTGQWYMLHSSTNYTTHTMVPWGLGTDVPVPADYDGDGKADPAVFRPSTNQWFITWSSSNYATYSVVSWGLSGDIPVPADYDGDGKADRAVFRPSVGGWFIRRSSNNLAQTFSWGLSGDMPINRRP